MINLDHIAQLKKKKSFHPLIIWYTWLSSVLFPNSESAPRVMTIQGDLSNQKLIYGIDQSSDPMCQCMSLSRLDVTEISDLI